MNLSSIIDRFRRNVSTNELCEVLRIVGLEVMDHRTALICEGANGLSTLLIPSIPADAQAEQWGRVMRIDRVEIGVHNREVKAALIGASHRIPIRRDVPVSTALSLIETGMIALVVLYQQEAEASPI